MTLQYRRIINLDRDRLPSRDVVGVVENVTAHSERSGGEGGDVMAIS